MTHLEDAVVRRLTSVIPHQNAEPGSKASRSGHVRVIHRRNDLSGLVRAKAAKCRSRRPAAPTSATTRSPKRSRARPTPGHDAERQAHTVARKRTPHAVQGTHASPAKSRAMADPPVPRPCSLEGADAKAETSQIPEHAPGVGADTERTAQIAPGMGAEDGTGLWHPRATALVAVPSPGPRSRRRLPGRREPPGHPGVVRRTATPAAAAQNPHNARPRRTAAPAADIDETSNRMLRRTPARPCAQRQVAHARIRLWSLRVKCRSEITSIPGTVDVPVAVSAGDQVRVKPPRRRPGPLTCAVTQGSDPR